MNNKNLNCHPERVEGSQLNCCFRSQPPEAKPNQVEPGDPEGSQQNCISPRDIAGNAKLNHEIADELRKHKRRHPDVEQSETEGSSQNKKALFHWILRAKALRMTFLSGTLFLLPPLAQAEQCTATPDCKSLGYTETSCPDGSGVKCPWNTSLMYCPKCKNTCTSKNSCEIGDVLYSDKKCYTCPANTLSGQVPIGVVFSSGKAVALTDLCGTMKWSSANSSCKNYSVGGVSGWHLPTKDELLAMYSNRSSVVQGFSNAIGGKDFVSDSYWSSSAGKYDATYNYYLYVKPVSGGSSNSQENYPRYVRPVLAF